MSVQLQIQPHESWRGVRQVEIPNPYAPADTSGPWVMYADVDESDDAALDRARDVVARDYYPARRVTQCQGEDFSGEVSLAPCPWCSHDMAYKGATLAVLQNDLAQPEMSCCARPARD